MPPAPVHSHDNCNHSHGHAGCNGRDPAHAATPNRAAALDAASDSPCARGECGHGSLGEHHPRNDAICLDDVSYAYPGSRPGTRSYAIRNVTLHVEQGCSLGIIGPNGAGKTTLLKIILGLLQGYTGHVRVFGHSPDQACRRGDIIGYVPQRHDVEWRFPVTAEQVVHMGLVTKTGLFRRYRRDDLDYAAQLMRMIGIEPLRKRPIGDLSGGQQQRVFIARALVSKPKVLILDEPMVGIDEVGQQQFAALVHHLHEQLNLTLIIVSHDIQAIAAGCNRVACLKQTIHYHDAPGGLTPQVLNEVFRHEVAPVIGQTQGVL